MVLYPHDSNNMDEQSRLMLESLIHNRYNESYKFLRSVAQAVLGPYYEDLKQFYLDIFQAEEYQYIVFVARRSIGLAELFSIIFWHENNIPSIRASVEASWANSLSDSTIMSYAPQIAQELKNGLCPKILIVDDLLVQGNGMNELLSTIESNVIRELQVAGSNADVDCWQDIVNAINIRVFAQNSKVSMVNLQYQLRLKPKYRMMPNEWHDLSRRISSLISFSGMANATFIMGAELPASSIDKKILPHGFRLNKQTLLEPVSEKCDTFHERHYFGWADPRQSYPKCYYTLRLIKNQFTNTYLLLPFIFLPQLSDRAYDLLKKKVFEKWGIDRSVCSFICDHGQTSRLEYEAMILHISESLMMCWTDAAEVSLIRRHYIPTKIALNYGINRQSPLMSKELFSRLTERAYLFSWDELTKLLLEVTEDSEPLVFQSDPIAQDIQDIRKKIEDNIYMTKLQEFAETYRTSQSLPPDHSKQVLDFSLMQNKQTNWNIFLDEFNASIFKHVSGLSAGTLFRHLLESMDYGIITLKARQSETRFAQVLRMSEQSLFIHPQRYAKYYPILTYLEERNLRLGTCLEEELRIFLKHEQSNGIIDQKINVDTLTAELTQYLSSLKKSGQDPDDWDIGFEKSLILDLNSVQTEPKMRRFYAQERFAFMEAAKFRRTLYNDCHAFYPL